jgi:hypothetical protein
MTPLELIEVSERDAAWTEQRGVPVREVTNAARAAYDRHLLLKHAQSPVPMILHCPACLSQHIDQPDERTPGWTNPPHRSHLCHVCGCIWRPADVATIGVAEIKTRGKADTSKGQMLSHAGALCAIEAHVRSIEIICDAHGFDSVQWLAP